jgi:hypothetical protein
MKKLAVLFSIILAFLVSCAYNPPIEVVPTCRIKIENKTNEIIYLNIRKAADPVSEDYSQLLCDRKIVVYTEEDTPYVVSYAVVTGQKTTIKDGILKTEKTVSTIQIIELTTDYLYNEITVTGATTWDIKQD